MAATRIYVLAKELSVKSSAIVSKCQDEGLDVKNHMSAISAGLAATILEWFSEGDNVTTIETATKVDLKRVRVRKKPKPKKVPEAEAPEPETAASAAESKAGADVAAEVAPAAQVPPPDAVADESDIAVQTVTAEEEKEEIPDQVVPVEAEDATSDGQPMTRKGPQIIEPPEPEPEPVVPAGPMLAKPKPAKLSGPQVVRVEAAEPVRAPRPRTAVRYDRPVTQPQMNVPAATGEQATAGKGKHHGKGKLGGHRRVEAPGETPRAKQRSKLRQRDIDERRARVEAAGG
ncbi:MAG: translation initiation factor IF-2 N-terminal domain-containing protein, partial [Planctomycetes bacterium]|nr:translation initiation factor IF-2 N-terminal domain-containing protein [Planctomycetota bacterium]